MGEGHTLVRGVRVTLPTRTTVHFLYPACVRLAYELVPCQYPTGAQYEQYPADSFRAFCSKAAAKEEAAAEEAEGFWRRSSAAELSQYAALGLASALATVVFGSLVHILTPRPSVYDQIDEAIAAGLAREGMRHGEARQMMRQGRGMVTPP